MKKIFYVIAISIMCMASSCGNSTKAGDNQDTIDTVQVDTVDTTAVDTINK